MIDPFSTRYRQHPLSQILSEVTSRRRRFPKISLIQVTKQETSTLIILFELLIIILQIFTSEKVQKITHYDPKTVQKITIFKAAS